jgi:hypothetical protein
VIEALADAGAEGTALDMVAGVAVAVLVSLVGRRPMPLARRWRGSRRSMAELSRAKSGSPTTPAMSAQW